ncbi:MAG: InlB B-repeat-containing protein [Lachnospiraceae bacterium]|nr:InlB B-repeat-containing protein [Lachnospiraceae bacterium]
MGKRMITLLLAVLVVFHMGMEPSFLVKAMEPYPQQGLDEEGMEELESTVEGNGEELENTEDNGAGAEDKEDNGEINLGGQENTEDTEEEIANSEDQKESVEEELEEPGEERYYTITFDLGGGMTAAGDKMITQQVLEGALPDQEAVATIIPVKEGYTFQGWNDKDGTLYTFEQPILEDLTLTACWQPISYLVRFDSNGGTGEMLDQNFTYEEEKELSKNQFTRTGYVFSGWKKDSITYQEGETVKNLASQEGEVVVLKAVWKQGSYKVQFLANGGKGEMEPQAFTYDKSKKLSKNQFTRTGYTFEGWNTKKNGKGKTYKNRQSVSNLTAKDNGVVKLYAVWKGVPYKVKYIGNGATSGKMENSSHQYGTKSKLSANKFKKKGYKFVKWSTQKNGKGKSYKNQAEIKTLTTKKNQVITLYAQWQIVNYKITYRTNGGKLLSSIKKTYNLKSKTFMLPKPTRRGYDFDGWYKEKKWKHRVDNIKYGSVGNLTVYAKWVKCTRQPRADSAKITSCKATAANTVKVKASIKKRIASEDDYYYLIYVDPISKRPGRRITKVFKEKTASFTVDVKENQGFITTMYGIAVRKNGKYCLMSKPSFVKNPENAANNKSAYKPGKTKKGIQFDYNVNEIHACDAKQYFLNLTVSWICGVGDVPYVYNGKTYYFNSLTYYQDMVRECNRNNVSVTIQILLDWQDGQLELINPKARFQGAAFYSWNIYEKQARERMEAMFCYLGKVFSQKDCYVSNWILGNEVNNPGDWNCAGSMTDEEYFETYAYTFRSLYYGIKSQYANAHIFICTDNYWNAAGRRRYSARQVVTNFTRYLNRIQKGLNWNLAYHAYSCPLTDTRFWNGWGTTGDVWTTPAITMDNINVLTDFIRDTYGPSVRVILSEQGFSSIPGQEVQAAAIAYSYYIAACNPMIDAFIIRSYTDDPVEVDMGLRMGILGKEAFDVFKYMDSKQTFTYTNRYLGVIGAPSWSQIVPGYKENRLWKMYRKQ